MTRPKAVKEIPASVTKVDTQTGKETNEPMTWKVIPPAAGKCQICAQTHEPNEPHNAFPAHDWPRPYLGRRLGAL